MGFRMKSAHVLRHSINLPRICVPQWLTLDKVHGCSRRATINAPVRLELGTGIIKPLPTSQLLRQRYSAIGQHNERAYWQSRSTAGSAILHTHP
jgi:hypothetical protein